MGAAMTWRFVSLDFFRRAGWPEKRTASFLDKLATAHGDNEVDDRLRCAKDAYAMEHPPGLHAISELIGEPTARLLAKWVGYRERDAASKAGARAASLENDLHCAKLVAEEFQGKLLYEPLGERFYRRRHGVYDPVSEVEI